jgi:hypothetical protein
VATTIEAIPGSKSASTRAHREERPRRAETRIVGAGLASAFIMTRLILLVGHAVAHPSFSRVPARSRV